MKFEDAFILMKKGEKVRLSGWVGYWYWDKDKETIMIQCKADKDGEKKPFDIRETKLVDYTISNILSNDWEKV